MTRHHLARPARAHRRPRLESLEGRTVPSGFTDDFEGPTLNSFWSREESSGTVVFPSNTLVHGGNQAVRLDTFMSAAHKGVNLMHFFDTPQYGRVSIWVYDTGAGAVSSNALYMDIYNPDAGRATWGVWDFDFGRPEDAYRMATDDVRDVHDGEVQTSFNRSLGWHQWTIDAVPGSITYSMDGQALHTVPLDLPFTRVLFGMGAPNWRPAWTVSFDDFEFVPLNQPKPDLEAKSLAWNTALGSVDLGYDITGADLTRPTTAGLYWSADERFDPDTDTLTHSLATEQLQGSYGPIHVSQDDFGVVPADARYLILALDPDAEVDESDETNNVLALEVPNRPPVVIVEPGKSTIRGGLFTTTGFFTDPDADTWTATVDFGDGTGIQPLELNADKTFTLSHTYTVAGNFTATVAVTDTEGAVGTDEVAVPVSVAAVLPDPCEPGATALFVGGTPANDRIVVVPSRQGLAVRINGKPVGTFPLAGRVVVYGHEGNDNIQVAGGVKVPAWLYGNDGNDRLKGGGGAAVLLGGDGADRLVGGRARDLLIGGAGADRLISGAADDLLIAGLTAHDDAEPALCAIQHEWARPDLAYADRVANLQDGTGHNGSVVLDATTIIDDADVDRLTGSAGLDWFLLEPGRDRVTDRFERPA
jgi:Ca2+-binding RTX toxin-like protein